MQLSKNLFFGNKKEKKMKLKWSRDFHCYLMVKINNQFIYWWYLFTFYTVVQCFLLYLSFNLFKETIISKYCKSRSIYILCNKRDRSRTTISPNRFYAYMTFSSEYIRSTSLLMLKNNTKEKNFDHKK